MEQLTGVMEAVSGQLSTHVMAHHDALIAGITNVAAVEDDLRAALILTRTSR